MRETPRLAHPLTASLLFAGSTISASYLLGEYSLPVSLRLVLAMLPVGGFLLLVFSWVTQYRQADELQQKILLEALAGGLVGSILGALGLYFFQKAGFFPPSEYPDLEFFGDLLAPSFLLGFVFAWWKASRRYR